MKRPLLVLAIITGVILAAALILTFGLERVQPTGTPTLENRRLIDGDPTPPDRQVPTSPPTDQQGAPAPVVVPPR